MGFIARVLEMCPEGCGSGTCCDQRSGQTQSMSTILQDLSPVPLPTTKPSNRGKFSDDREYWEQLHHARYTKWQLGHSADDIALEEGVTSYAVRHSTACCEGRLSNAQVVQARNARASVAAIARLSEKYIEELEKLMSGCQSHCPH